MYVLTIKDSPLVNNILLYAIKLIITIENDEKISCIQLSIFKEIKNGIGIMTNNDFKIGAKTHFK